METGRVKWFKNDKGYGMIVPDNGGRDVIFHKASIQIDGSGGVRSLGEGLKVNFDLVKCPKGLEAINVRLW